MAIANIDPVDWKSANSVLVDSTATRNIEAIHEIDDWATENGFERVNEFWLRQRMASDGTRIFRGVCVRIAPDELHAREVESQAVMERMSRMEAEPHEARGVAGVR